jgi:hypothetical protein
MWLQNIDDRLYTGVCFLDISKCFDTIDHNLLLKKMKKYGVKNIELNWFASYLSDRTQSVRQNNILSEPLEVKIGVPQGSTLGPLLFMVFVNDLPIFVNNGRCSMYADDTIVYCNNADVNHLVGNMNDTLFEVNEWYKANRLVLNISKSNSMLIGSNVNDDDIRNFQVTLGGMPLNCNQSTKYLGVHIDQNLKFETHVSELSSVLSRKLSWLARLRHIVPNNVLQLTYITYIMPVFDYACSVWGCTRKNIDVVQRLQNRAARIVSGNFDIINVRGIDLVKELGWQTIEERVNYFLSVTMYNSIYGYAPSYLCNSVVMACEANDRNTRINNTLQVDVPSSRTSDFERSFIYRASNFWNTLPHSIHMATSTESFKRLLKDYTRANTANI